MNQLLEEKYKELGISEKVYAFGEKIEQELKTSQTTQKAIEILKKKLQPGN